MTSLPEQTSRTTEIRLWWPFPGGGIGIYAESKSVGLTSEDVRELAELVERLEGFRASVEGEFAETEGVQP
jgi:hypothetical protein